MEKMEIKFDERGREIPDPRQIEMPAGMSRPLTIEEQIQRYVRDHLSRAAVENGTESFEESDDLEWEDSDADDFLTPYEVHMMAREAVDRDASNLEAKEPVTPPPAETGSPSSGTESPVGNAAAGT